MNKVKIITDSTADLTREIYEENNIDVVPLGVRFGDKVFSAGELSLEELYEKVEEYDSLPATAGATPTQFEEAFKKAIDEGYDVVYMGIGSTLSTTFQSAYIGKQSFPEDRIFLVDSKSLSTGTGLLVMKAVKLANEGKSAKEIAEILTSMVPNVVAEFAVETLDYLHKGGRCSGTAMIIGKIFHIHPYIKVVDGKLIVYKKPRGPMKIAFQEQLNELKAALPNVDPDHVFITHSIFNKADIEYYRSELAKIVPAESIIITETGSLIGSHCGPGTVGVLFLKK